MQDNPIQKFGLKAAEFAQLQSNLLRGDETLFERVFVKHFDDCRVYLIRNCSAQASTKQKQTSESGKNAV